MPAANILQTIGNTPHIRVNRLFGPAASVWIKSERANPGGSIKDRIALSMVEDAEATGKLPPGRSSSPPRATRASAWRWSPRSKGYPLVLVMPDSMSIERRRLMLAYGATSVLSPRAKASRARLPRRRNSATASNAIRQYGPRQLRRLPGPGNLVQPFLELDDRHVDRAADVPRRNLLGGRTSTMVISPSSHAASAPGRVTGSRLSLLSR